MIQTSVRPLTYMFGQTLQLYTGLTVRCLYRQALKRTAYLMMRRTPVEVQPLC